ncbi:MAG TPA: hypothetical protein ENK02_07820 [Planctomycetes bacterium]|nr:hypothetical protein [Planctomycetota bacterium]
MQISEILGLSWGLLAGLGLLTSPLPGQGFQRNSGERAYRLLQKKYDKDGDGKVSRKEYPRGRETFARLDRNGDGFLTLEDFGGGRGRNREAMRKRLRRMALQSALGSYFKKARSIDHKAWIRFLKEWDVNGDGRLEDLEAMEIGLAPRTVRMLMGSFGLRSAGGSPSSLDLSSFAQSYFLLDADGDKILSRAEFLPPNRGSAGSRAPRKGEKAPDFNLPRVHDAKSLVRLSSFAGKKPVALIFGSYT